MPVNTLCPLERAHFFNLSDTCCPHQSRGLRSCPLIVGVFVHYGCTYRSILRKKIHSVSNREISVLQFTKADAMGISLPGALSSIGLRRSWSRRWARDWSVFAVGLYIIIFYNTCCACSTCDFSVRTTFLPRILRFYRWLPVQRLSNDYSPSSSPIYTCLCRCFCGVYLFRRYITLPTVYLLVKSPQ